MRFISQARRMTVQIQGGRVEYLAGGIERPIIPNILVDFESQDVTDEEIDFAEKTFSGFAGFKMLRDEVTREPLRNRMSSFDTELPAHVNAWAALDEQFGKPAGHHKQLVEEVLLARSGPDTDILLVTERQASAPWPKYNDFAGSFEDLVARVVDDGYDLDEVLLYERQNLNRAEVVELYEMLIRDRNAALEQGVAAGDYIPA